MAKLITKTKYLKPDSKKSIGNFARYIATREGVEKIDDSKRYAPPTKGQQEIIQKLIKDFPESKDSFEYQDYLNNETMGTASDFILRTVEDYSYELAGRKGYAKYIATRPRAERFGSHGLFTAAGVEIKLTEVMRDLDNHEGNVWTMIVSLRREDAERLGYNTGGRWRDMLRTQASVFSENMKISIENLHWYGAFHNETHHPHVHLIIYSDEPKEGYLTEKGLNNIRSALGKQIFHQDLISVYKKQTKQRDSLRDNASDIIKKLVDSINSGVSENSKMESMLFELGIALSKTKGKKVYGYLPRNIKDMVDNIVNELAADERIKRLYDLWYEQRESILRIYTDDLPERIPLVNNKEFKKIKNAIISEALLLNNPENTPNVSMPNQEQETDEKEDKKTTPHDTNTTKKSPPPAISKPLGSQPRGVMATACIRLMRYLTDLIRRSIDDDKRKMVMESKTKKKTEDKKQGLGLH